MGSHQRGIISSFSAASPLPSTSLFQENYHFGALDSVNDLFHPQHATSLGLSEVLRNLEHAV